MDSIIPKTKGKRNGFKKISQVVLPNPLRPAPGRGEPARGGHVRQPEKGSSRASGSSESGGGRAASVSAQDEGAPVLTVKPEAGRSRQRPGIPEISRAIRSAASFVSAGLPKEENRKYPSPQDPNPAPGVPTT